MDALPADIQARRDAEDCAVKLGQERVRLAKQAAGNTREIKELMPVAL